MQVLERIVAYGQITIVVRIALIDPWSIPWMVCNYKEVVGGNYDVDGQNVFLFKRSCFAYEPVRDARGKQSFGMIGIVDKTTDDIRRLLCGRRLAIHGRKISVYVFNQAVQLQP